jgi:hypothetical protein
MLTLLDIVAVAAAATKYYTEQTEALGRCDVITNASSFVFVLSFFGACVCVRLCFPFYLRSRQYPSRWTKRG